MNNFWRFSESHIENYPYYCNSWVLLAHKKLQLSLNTMDIFKNSIRVFIIINFFSVNAAETFFPLFFFLREKKKQSCQGWCLVLSGEELNSNRVWKLLIELYIKPLLTLHNKIKNNPRFYSNLFHTQNR